MPKEVFGRDYQFLPRSELLTYEEIERLSRIFVAHGIEKIRLTGGEPLVRRNLERLIEMLAAVPGLDDLTLTTNGSLLAGKARALKDAGLRRITVSLDSLDNEVFTAMNDVDFPVERVLAGIEAAAAAGLGPIKINMVVRRGLNEGSVLPMARYFRGTGMILRFIEYMDVGHTNGWRLDDVVPAAEIIETIDAELPLEPVEANYSGEVANRWGYRDGSGEIGVIASVTQPFCGGCTAPGSPPRASSTPASSRSEATTSARSSAAAPPTPRSSTPSPASGGSVTTATPRSARPRRSGCRRSRCPTSAASPLRLCRQAYSAPPGSRLAARALPRAAPSG